MVKSIKNTDAAFGERHYRFAFRLCLQKGKGIFGEAAA